ERRPAEKNFSEPPGVFFKLAAFSGCVAVSHDQQVDFGWRLAIFLNGEQRAGRRWPRIVDELVLGIDRGCPDVVKLAFLPFFEHDGYRRLRYRKPQRLRKCPAYVFGLVGGHPFAENRAKSARIEQAIAGFVVHFEEIVT